MNNTSRFAALTTIQPPTPSMSRFCRVWRRHGFGLLVAGDRKGPEAYDLVGVELLSLQAQKQLPFTLAGGLPEGHYTRKNLAYLVAMQRGAGVIYETDDDNAPLPHWYPRECEVRARRVNSPGWCNVYRFFSDSDFLWPRGFPLDQATATRCVRTGRPRTVQAPVQQGLANGSPDVDAVWRLLANRDVSFTPGESVLLAPGTWCPFNSQSTWWWPPAFPLMYLPSLCSFRMTDIWRSFVAQRCLWALGCGVVFHSPEVLQRRNPHDVLRDFADEIPGYLQNRRLCAALDGLTLSTEPADAGANLQLCYEELVRIGLLPAEELDLVRAWLTDVAETTASAPRAKRA